MQQLISQIKIHNIFIIDACGALATASILAVFYFFLSDYIGLPGDILMILSMVALCFAIFSSLAHRVSEHKRIKLLRVIIAANLSYCVATLLLVLMNFKDLPILGIVYFMGEIIVILFLVNIERKVLRQSLDEYQL